MTERRATLVGLAVASAVPPLILAACALPSEAGIHGPIGALLFMGVTFLVFLPYSALLAVVFGVPAFLLCRRFGLVTWWFALIVGALAGILVSIAVRSGEQSYARVFLKYVPLGCIAALAFWGVWQHSEHGS